MAAVKSDGPSGVPAQPCSMRVALPNPGFIEMSVFDGLRSGLAGRIEPGLTLLLMEAVSGVQRAIARLDDSGIMV